MLLMKKETIEKFQTPALRKKFFQDEQTKLEYQVASVRKDKEDAKKSIEQTQAKVAEYQEKV
jgi:hypothetical protein